MNKRKKAEGTRARSSAQRADPLPGRPSRATPARARGFEPASAGPQVSEREGTGDATTTSRRRRRLAGATPASQIARHRTPPTNYSRPRVLEDTGYLKQAAPLPGEHRNDAGDEHRGDGETTASGIRFRKRGREGKARRGAGAHPRRVQELSEDGGAPQRR